VSENPQSAGQSVRIGSSTTLLGVVLAGLGGFVLYEAVFGPASSTYARVGPGFFPAIVGSATIIVGLALVAQALRGKWSMMLIDETRAAGATAKTDNLSPIWRILLVILGLVANLLLITPFGFVIASAVMFTFTTRAFGSRNLLANAGIGLLFTGTIYLCFRYGLNLHLPVGSIWG
jgi:putative tricarboxylic transport membrane protein